MVPDPTTQEFDSLGTFLRNHRREKKIDMATIVNETKIPPKTIEAIENDDFSSLPAEAFARGFYVLYARCLGLDADQVLSRYEQVRGLPPKATYEVTSIQGHDKPVNTLAAPPAISFSSLLGFALVMAIVAVGGICWYLSWNPATFISEQLRSFQEPTVEDTKDESVPVEEKSEKKEKDLTMKIGPSEAHAGPLVVMTGTKKSHTTKNGIVFITVPITEPLNK